MSRLECTAKRAECAAGFAAVGAGVCGLFGRNTASSGAALRALPGAALVEKRSGMGTVSAQPPTGTQ
jgi:hypothetical protein